MRWTRTSRAFLVRRSGEKLEKASPSGIARVFSFIGQALRHTPDELSRELAVKLTTLWNRRLERAQADPPSAVRQPELKHFGAWLASARLDRDWSYRQLLALCALGVAVNYDEAFLERLSADAPEKPTEVITALSFLLLASTSDWQYVAAEQKVMAVVKRVYDAPDREANEKADELINALGARGYFQYRALRLGSAISK